jgi:hypothetical protein
LLSALKSRRLLTVNTFRDVAVEERIRDIQLVSWLVLGGDKREHGPDCRWLDERGEGFAEVDP